MLAVSHWHHPGRAIGGGAVVRSCAGCSCYAAGERLGRRGVAIPACAGLAPRPRFEFRSGPPSLCGRWAGGRRRRRRRGRRRRGEEDLDGNVMFGRNSAAPCFSESEASSKCPQSCSPFPLLPLAAVALIFSRAGVLMGGCVEMLVPSSSARTPRREVRRNARACPPAEEFEEAAKGRRPWRPGLGGALVRQGGVGLALLSASTIAHDHLTPVITTLRANPTFMSGLIAWVIAQVAKVFTYYTVVREWDFRMVMGSGGMPSSHSALCFALTTSVAVAHGVSDALFPVCLGFTLIVMYDAAGVRRHAGRQAEVLNMIVADLFQGHPISERKLKELLGHTPLQVFAGAVLGIVVGYICSKPRLT